MLNVKLLLHLKNCTILVIFCMLHYSLITIRTATMHCTMHTDTSLMNFITYLEEENFNLNNLNIKNKLNAQLVLSLG